MDMGWIATYGSSQKMSVHISFMSEGGSSAPVPDLSIEVDDLDTVLERIKHAKIPIEYGTNERWGVRRFFVRDPFGKLVNVMVHASCNQLGGWWARGRCTSRNMTEIVAVCRWQRRKPAAPLRTRERASPETA
jgi:hypothetical protein